MSPQFVTLPKILSWGASFEVQCVLLSVMILIYSIWHARRGADALAHFWLIVIAWYLAFLGTVTAFLRGIWHLASLGSSLEPANVILARAFFPAVVPSLVPTAVFTILAVALWPRRTALPINRDTKLALSGLLAAFLSVLLLSIAFVLLFFVLPAFGPQARRLR